MKTAVCAIRGGEASRNTQQNAIELAKENGLKIIFLYVIDQSLIDTAEERIKKELRDEIIRMGRLLLRVARSQAKKKGVEADFAIGEGTIREAIEKCIKENNAEFLILGKPKEEHNQKNFNIEQLETFAEMVSESTGVKVEII